MSRTDTLLIGGPKDGTVMRLDADIVSVRLAQPLKDIYVYGVDYLSEHTSFVTGGYEACRAYRKSLVPGYPPAYARGGCHLEIRHMYWTGWKGE